MNVPGFTAMMCRALVTLVGWGGGGLGNERGEKDWRSEEMAAEGEGMGGGEEVRGIAGSPMEELGASWH